MLPVRPLHGAAAPFRLSARLRRNQDRHHRASWSSLQHPSRFPEDGRRAIREAQRGHVPRQAWVNEQLTICGGASSGVVRTVTVEA